MEPITVYLALGSNLGDRRGNLMDAISQLRQRLTVEQLSSVYETEAAYITDQPPYLNMVVRATLDPERLPPLELLRFLKSVERRLGRLPTVRYGSRPIDLDILLYGDWILDEPELTIPHPRLAERAFVLAPLAEIAPDLRLPQQTKSVSALAQQVDGVGKVIRKERSLHLQFARDVQDELPPARLSLTHVGVSGIKRIVRLAGNSDDALLYAEMDLYVELRPDQKGAHMSRFSDTVEEVITEVSAEQTPSLDKLAEKLARQLLRDQRALRSDVHIRAHYPLERHAPVSGKLTQEIYTLIGMAAATEHRVVHLVGAEAEGMTACPCAQDMIGTYARERLLEAGFSPADANRALAVVPLATHNQRGRGRLLIGAEYPLHAPDLINLVEGAMSSENYDLLKRPDELFVVAKAHRHPRFVEDVVREMLYGVAEQYPDLPDDAFVLARQVNLETIHKHDVYAERSGTLGELRQEMKGDGYFTPHTTLDAWLRVQLKA
jgi:GTP cyclohydrolase-4